jgi:hypothetical protein
MPTLQPWPGWIARQMCRMRRIGKGAMSRVLSLPARTFQYAELARRTLLLRVRKDGAVSALRCVMRGEAATHRRSFPTITDPNAATIYAEILRGPEFDFVTPRIRRGGRWVSLLREEIPLPTAGMDTRTPRRSAGRMPHAANRQREFFQTAGGAL